MKIPMNSDSACMMLEAEDILSGNIFLSDQNLTGISFLTTDLPWFIIGTAIFGVGLNAFRLSVFLMYIFMISSAGVLAIRKAENKLLAYCVFFGVAAIPTVYALSNAFVHTAGFAMAFLTVLAAEMYAERPSKKRFAAVVIITAFAVCGDRSSLAISVLPLLIFFFLKGISKSKNAIFGIVSGCAAGFLLEKLYLFIGGANLNSLSRTSFAEVSDIPKNIRIYIDYFLRLLNARFFGKELFSLKTAVFAFKILLVFAVIFIVFKCVRAAILHKNADCAVFTLGVGFTLVSLMLFLTTMNSDLTSGRYIAYLTPFLGVVLARASDSFKLDFKKSLAVCVAFLVLALTGIMPHGSPFGTENTYSRLAAFLENENLTEGYAAFWDSSVLSAYSDGKLSVRAIKFEDGMISPRVWFCKNSWYDVPKNFVIIRKSPSPEEDNYRYNGIFTSRVGYGFDYHITEDNIKSALGEPKQVKNFENYSVFLYDEIPLNKEELWKN